MVRRQAWFCLQMLTRWPHSWRGIVASGCDLLPAKFRRISLADVGRIAAFQEPHLITTFPEMRERFPTTM